MIRFSDEFNSYQHMSLIEWIFLFDESQERCRFHHAVLEVFSLMCVCVPGEKRIKRTHRSGEKRAVMGMSARWPFIEVRESFP